MKPKTINAIRSAVLTCRLYYGNRLSGARMFRSNAAEKRTPFLRRTYREWALERLAEARLARDTARELDRCLWEELTA